MEHYIYFVYKKATDKLNDKTKTINYQPILFISNYIIMRMNNKFIINKPIKTILEHFQNILWNKYFNSLNQMEQNYSTIKVRNIYE